MPLFINSMFLSQELVDDLYSFRDRYFETHGVEDAGRKQNDVAQEMAKTLKRLEEKEGGDFFVFHKFLWKINCLIKYNLEINEKIC